MKEILTKFFGVIFIIIILTVPGSALTPDQPSGDDPAVRIKDITRIEGIETQQLIGYGLVVGLDGTGDGGSVQTIQSVANMMQNFGMQVSPEDMDTDNVASVMITAEVPSFARPGDEIDITLSSIGDADNLQGGTLLMSPLLGPNREEVYAQAQGSVSVGGYGQDDNHPTVGRVPGGGQMEKELHGDVVRRGEITILLDNPDFTTAGRITDVINSNFGYTAEGRPYARAESPQAVSVQVPSHFERQQVEFISRIQQLEVRPDTEAKVVFNERTGTVVMGHNVRMSRVSISHGDLTVTVAGEEEPQELDPDIEDPMLEEEDEDDGATMMMPRGSSVSEVVQALNAVGAEPEDIIAILQAIDRAGALHADLEIM